MNGTKAVEDGDSGGQVVVAVVEVAEERFRAQEMETLKQMRVKVAKLDPPSGVSTETIQFWSEV